LEDSKAVALSDAVLKRIEFALSSLHFTIWMPVIATIGVGLVGGFLSLDTSPFLKGEAIALTVLGVGIVSYIILKRIHTRQQVLWKLYAFALLNAASLDSTSNPTSNSNKFAKLQDTIAKIQGTWWPLERHYESQISRFKTYCGIPSSETA